MCGCVLVCLGVVPGSRASPATPHRAPHYSSCSVEEECQPGTGSETASGSGGPGCPHTESPGSGSHRCSFWSTVWKARGKGIPESWHQAFSPLTGELTQHCELQAQRGGRSCSSELFSLSATLAAPGDGLRGSESTGVEA